MSQWETAIKCLLKCLGYSQSMRDAQLSLLSRPDVKSLRSMWYEIYRDSISNEVFKPVEDLPQEEKKELWNYTRELAPNLPHEEKIKLSKCLIAIEYYLNNPV